MAPIQKIDTSLAESVPELMLKPDSKNGFRASELLEYRACLKFDFDDIDDPVFGCATGIKGEIPILHSTKPFRSRIELMKADPQLLERLVWDMVRKYREAWPELDDDEIYNLLKPSVRPIFILMGDGLDHDTQLRDFGVEFITLMTVLDRELDGRIGKKELSDVPEGFDLLQFLDAVRLMRKPAPEDFPAGLQQFDRLRGLYATLDAQLYSAIPDFDDEEYGTFFGPEVYAVIKAYLGMYEMEMEKNELQFSTETTNELMRLMAGWNIVASILLITHRVRLSTRVRGSMMMDISWTRVGDILALVNAIIGLHRDIRLNQLDSPITYAVKCGGLSMQETWDAAMKRLHALYKDYRIANEKLVEVFKDEKDAAAIRKYIEVMDTLLDGCVFAYSLADRYGVEHQIKIVE